MTRSEDDLPKVFIIRIWQESRNAIIEWRGSVEHVPTQERIYFLHTEKLVEFIINKTGANMMQRRNPVIFLLNRLIKSVTKRFIHDS